MLQHPTPPNIIQNTRGSIIWKYFYNFWFAADPSSFIGFYLTRVQCKVSLELWSDPTSFSDFIYKIKLNPRKNLLVTNYNYASEQFLNLDDEEKMEEEIFLIKLFPTEPGGEKRE